MIFIEQSVSYQENSRIYGTYVVNCDDEKYLQELKENNVRIGYVTFDYDVSENQLTFEPVNCRSAVSAHYQELVETVWSKIKLIQNYWKSDDYHQKRIIDDRINGNKETDS